MQANEAVYWQTCECFHGCIFWCSQVRHNFVPSQVVIFAIQDCCKKITLFAAEHVGLITAQQCEVSLQVLQFLCISRAFKDNVWFMQDVKVHKLEGYIGNITALMRLGFFFPASCSCFVDLHWGGFYFVFHLLPSLSDNTCLWLDLRICEQFWLLCWLFYLDSNTWTNTSSIGMYVTASFNL